MNATQKKYFLDQKNFRTLVRDYTLSADEFWEILQGKKTHGWFTQTWAIARIIEQVNYYDAISLIGLDRLYANWDMIKTKIFNISIKRGYEFVLRRYALSVTG